MCFKELCKQIFFKVNDSFIKDCKIKIAKT